MNTNRKNESPVGLPREIEVTIQQGRHPKTGLSQWTGSYQLEAPYSADSVKTSNPFAAALGHLIDPEPITVKVVVNEKEWSGPLAEGEIWMVQPNNYLPDSKIMFADALYRAKNSPVVRDSSWMHPMVLDMFERMAWDIRSVSCGGLIKLGAWRWEDRHVFESGRSVKPHRSFKETREGGLKAIRSEAGWLHLTIEFGKEAPTEEDYYHYEYWTEEFVIPLHECKPNWTYLHDFSGPYEVGHTIYVDSGEAFSLPLLLKGTDRGLAGPFDQSMIGRQLARVPGSIDYDALITRVLPGCILKLSDRGVAEQVRASRWDFIGVVSSVARRANGAWEVMFEQNTLWFKSGHAWRKLGMPHQKRSYRGDAWTLPKEQVPFLGFRSLLFQSLELPEQTGLVPQYQLVRDSDGDIVGFEGEMELRGRLCSEHLLSDGTHPSRKRAGSTYCYIYDPSSYDFYPSQFDLPEELWRRFGL
ncbi:MAG: hypothetical protein JWN49_419 [Parcubacteria group bacterium]|nr:hypothetical protein [Parcubacteria group bacterium]